MSSRRARAPPDRRRRSPSPSRSTRRAARGKGRPARASYREQRGEDVGQRDAPVLSEPALETAGKPPEAEKVDGPRQRRKPIHARMLLVELPGVQREDRRLATVAEPRLGGRQGTLGQQ